MKGILAVITTCTAPTLQIPLTLPQVNSQIADKPVETSISGQWFNAATKADK